MLTHNEAKLSGVAILTFFANNLCQCKLTIDGRYPMKTSDSINITMTILILALASWMGHRIDQGAKVTVTIDKGFSRLEQ
jgi:hypothetical protein